MPDTVASWGNTSLGHGNKESMRFLERNLYPYRSIVVDCLSFYPDPHILPAFAPASWKNVRDCGVSDNACSDEIIKFSLAGMCAKNWIGLSVFVTDSYTLVKRGASCFRSWVRLSPARLLPVNDYQSSIDALSYSISSSPVVCKTDSATCHQNEDQHNPHSCSIPSFSSRSQ